MTRAATADRDTRFLAEAAILGEFVAELQSNADYVAREIDNLPDSAEVKASIVGVCDGLNGLACDLRSEVLNLHDKLGLRPGEPPYDPDIVNPDPRVTLGLFRNWPREELGKLNELVQRLTGEDSAGFVLVAESATNILNAYHRAMEAADRIERLLDQNPAGIRR